ncbi:MAG: hypothetical protein HY255_08930 [Betaproteobacteria bacterium]|nr:hypothetical protein [Betaproteobacteria bacterium]
MTDRETFIEFWTPTVGADEAARLFEVKQERERRPLRSASVYVMPSYQSPVTGKWIDTPAQRRDDLARSGSRPWEGMASEQKDAERRKQAAGQEMDRVAEEIAVESWRQLPEGQKRVLL